MKAITITVKRMWIEIAVSFLCFMVAEGLNLYAIKKYGTDWNELWTQLPVILILAFVFYAIFSAARILFRIMIKFLCYVLKLTDFSK